MTEKKANKKPVTKNNANECYVVIEYKCGFKLLPEKYREQLVHIAEKLSLLHGNSKVFQEEFNVKLMGQA